MASPQDLPPSLRIPKSLLPVVATPFEVLEIKGARAQRMRLISCQDFIFNDSFHFQVKVKEIPAADFSQGGIPKYAVVSYSSMGWGDSSGWDPHALYQVCQIALLKNIEYLWFDRVCVLQTDADKAWHAENIGSIFRHAKLCIVVPGDKLSKWCEWPDVLKWGTELGRAPPHVLNPWTLLEVLCAFTTVDEMLFKLIVLHKWGRNTGPGKWVLDRPDVRLGLREGSVVPLELLASTRAQLAPPPPLSSIAFSPLVILLQGAISGLRFQPKHPTSNRAYPELEGTRFPQLFGRTVVGSPLESPIPSPCDDKIRLLLEILAMRVHSTGEQPTRRFKEAILASAFSRVYRDESDIIHILRPFLWATTTELSAVLHIASNPGASHLTQSLLNILLPGDQSSAPPFWAWLFSRSRSPSHIPTFMAPMCLPGPEWDGHRVDAAFEELSPAKVWRKLRSNEFLAACTIRRVMVQSSHADEPPLVELRARPVPEGSNAILLRTLDSLPPDVKRVRFLHIGTWKLPSEGATRGPGQSQPKALLLMVTKRLSKPGASDASYAHTAWCTVPADTLDINQVLEGVQARTYRLVVGLGEAVPSPPVVVGTRKEHTGSQTRPPTNIYTTGDIPSL